MYMQLIDEPVIALLRSTCFIRPNHEKICQVYSCRHMLLVLACTRGRSRMIFHQLWLVCRCLQERPRLASQCPYRKSNSMTVCLWRSLSNMTQVVSEAPGSGKRARCTSSKTAFSHRQQD
ncbi:hypothetical protein F5Y04DRAFT_173247 [Hypomontagnella monticulosa]|nr:hypothetical protein F5Y04DRAFT_173247 [Hypomontagnella monticulosa]